LFGDVLINHSYLVKRNQFYVIIQLELAEYSLSLYNYAMERRYDIQFIENA